MDYLETRRKYPKFIYHSYGISEDGDCFKIVYNFETVGLTEFHPSWQLPRNGLAADDEFVNAFAFNLGMAELVSYWKATCSPEVTIECGSLDEEQKRWWKKLYFNGLGEFFYVNGISANPDDFMSIACAPSADKHDLSGIGSRPLRGCMIPVGGGKDSIVALDILSRAGETDENMCFIMNHRNSSLLSAMLSGYGTKQLCRPLRYLDRTIVDLNKRGFFNGHTPISSVIAFSAAMEAYICGRKYVVLSNESSANEASVAGGANHQYSKSFEFEKDFSEYLHKYLPCGVEYFSLLRPLSELQIAAIFSELKEFHQVFRSCNAGNAGKNFDTWCLNCSKCLFVVMILSPFLSDAELKEIFRINLLDSGDERMLGFFEQLIGLRDTKPFECVGSIDEVNYAMCLAVKNRLDSGAPLPRLLDYYTRTSACEKYRDKPNPYVNYFDEANLIPDRLKALVRERAAKIKW